MSDAIAWPVLRAGWKHARLAEAHTPSILSLRSALTRRGLWSDGNKHELAERLLAALDARKMQPDLKILLTSGYTERYLTPREKISDRAELLSKPYSRRTLARTVRQVLDSPL